jgi:hypothetical protein
MVEFDSVAAELEAAWSRYGGRSGLTWRQAYEAVRDSWHYTDALLADALATDAARQVRRMLAGDGFFGQPGAGGLKN